MTDRKKSRSRESSTPFWNPSKWVITLNDVTKSTRRGATCSSTLITGGKPARIRNRQTTSEMMKLTTWLRVSAEVMQLIAR